eukprot:3587773-Rhodomonas_salina.1
MSPVTVCHCNVPLGRDLAVCRCYKMYPVRICPVPSRPTVSVTPGKVLIRASSGTVAPERWGLRVHWQCAGPGSSESESESKLETSYSGYVVGKECARPVPCG